jgi:periplasmic divalent cation tolerance protein
LSEAVIVLTTFPAEGDVEAFAARLVEERLAACVNVLPPMRSIYRWQGAIETADERQLVIKTTQPRIEELRTRLKTLHPYDVPEFLVLTVSAGSPDYRSWLTESTRP